MIALRAPRRMLAVAACLRCLAQATLVLVVAADAAVAQTAAPPLVRETTLELSDGSTVRYAIALPDAYEESAADPRALVLSLHPGGSTEYYGSSFMQSIVEPALRSWRAVIVAPDAPGGSWTTPRSEAAVLALVEHVRAEHAIDPLRVLVTGYSMGGRGTWYLAARHPEVFTGAIVMAGSPAAADIGGITGTPLYLIHSPDDEVAPFDRAEGAYRVLAARGHPVEMRVLPGFTHYAMGAYVPSLRLAGTWMLERWRGADGRP